MARYSVGDKTTPGNTSKTGSRSSEAYHDMHGTAEQLEGFEVLLPMAPPPRGEQGVLFKDPVSIVDENLGYRGSVARKAAGSLTTGLVRSLWCLLCAPPQGLGLNGSIVSAMYWFSRSLSAFSIPEYLYNRFVPLLTIFILGGSRTLQESP